MVAPTADQLTVQDLTARFQLHPVDKESVYGDIATFPVTMSILGGDPLALLFAFRVRTGEDAALAVPTDLQSALAEARGTLTLEDGYAWLSLHNLGGRSSDDIEALVRRTVEALAESALHPGPGCATCGTADGVELRHLEGRTLRICPACLDHLYAAKKEEERAMNRPSLLGGVGLPAVLAMASVGWMLFWLGVDLFLDWRGLRVLIIDQYLGTLIICVLGAVGFGLGTFLGNGLRQSGLSLRAPTWVGGAAVCLLALGGEILYIAVMVFRAAGIFDLAHAARLLIPFLQSYDWFWITARLIVIGAAALGCMQAASPKTAPLRI